MMPISNEGECKKETHLLRRERVEILPGLLPPHGMAPIFLALTLFSQFPTSISLQQSDTGD